MITRVQKWGNSQGLRLSKELLSGVGIAIGDPVEVSVHENTVVLTPLRRKRGEHSLQDLVARIPEGYESDGDVWGPPVGREIW